MTNRRLAIGVLALQGDVDEHMAALERAGAQALAVRTLSEFERVDALVVPGGESTTVMKLLDRFGLSSLSWNARAPACRCGARAWG